MSWGPCPDSSDTLSCFPQPAWVSLHAQRRQLPLQHALLLPFRHSAILYSGMNRNLLANGTAI